jgi:hypothetical protein
MRFHCILRRSVRKAVFLGTMAVFSLSALLVGQEAAKTLAITQIEPIPLEGPDRPASGQTLYYRVDLVLPQAWQEAEKTFQVLVDGQPAPFEQFGSSSIGGTDGADFWVYLGKPGKKKVEVSLMLDGKPIRAEREFNAASQPAMRLLGHYSGECVLENEPLRFFAYSIKDASVEVNGKKFTPETQPIPGFESLAILSIPPSLVPGNNLIEYSGHDLAGKRLFHSATLYYLAGNRMKVGERFLFTWGHPGTRSGPYFRLTLDGDALALGEKGQDVRILEQDRNGWIGGTIAWSHPVTAKKAGTGQLDLFETHRYLMPEKLEKTIQITVEP